MKYQALTLVFVVLILFSSEATQEVNKKANSKPIFVRQKQEVKKGADPIINSVDQQKEVKRGANPIINSVDQQKEVKRGANPIINSVDQQKEVKRGANPIINSVDQQKEVKRGANPIINSVDQKQEVNINPVVSPSDQGQKLQKEDRSKQSDFNRAESKIDTQDSNLASQENKKEVDLDNEKPAIVSIPKEVRESQEALQSIQPTSTERLSLEEISNKSTAYVVSETNNKKQSGSGFFLAEKLFVTNQHIVENAILQSDGRRLVTIRTPEGVKDIGFVVAEDKMHDLAIIEVTKSHRPLPLGDYSKVKMGDEIFVLGSPEGLIGTLSKGIVSSTKRKINNIPTLQITAPISQGSSGSPVLSKDFKVIGIVMASLPVGQNINFAVPVTFLKKLKNKLNIQLNVQNFPAHELSKIAKKSITDLLNSDQASTDKPLQLDYKKGIQHFKKRSYKKAFWWFKKAVSQKNKSKQSILALAGMYRFGLGTTQNNPQAFYLFRQAASKESAEAKFQLGVMYHLGLNQPKTSQLTKDDQFKLALSWYKKAASQGHVTAQILFFEEEKCKGGGSSYKRGEYHYSQKDYRRALHCFTKAAHRDNHPGAKFRLGLMYLYGQGVYKNETEAFHWFTQSALQGFVDAQFQLGNIYHYKALQKKSRTLQKELPKTESDVKKIQLKKQMRTLSQERKLSGDYKDVVFWYKKAADQGHTVAQNFLGMLYYLGQDVPKDYGQAFYWFEKAAGGRHAYAQFRLGQMYLTGQGRDVSNLIYAYVWWHLAAFNGSKLAPKWINKKNLISKMSPKQIAVAQILIGIQFDLGQGVFRDSRQAVVWYKRAAQQGNAEAQVLLGLLLDKGGDLWSSKKLICDFSWLKLAVSKKHIVNLQQTLVEKMSLDGMSLSQILLSTVHLGQGIPQNYKQSFYWYKKAADQEDVTAQTLLGLKFNKGQGSLRNFLCTYSWFSLLTPKKDTQKQKDVFLEVVKAQILLGLMDLGSGGKNSKQALYWYKKAAGKKSSAEAKFYLALMFAKGQGVAKDHLQALKWLKEAASQGHATAQILLSIMYAKGLNVSQSFVYAYSWLDLAIKRGYGGATELKQRLKSNMTLHQTIMGEIRSIKEAEQMQQKNRFE